MTGLPLVRDVGDEVVAVLVESPVWPSCTVSATAKTAPCGKEAIAARPAGEHEYACEDHARIEPAGWLRPLIRESRREAHVRRAALLAQVAAVEAALSSLTELRGPVEVMPEVPTVASDLRSLAVVVRKLASQTGFVYGNEDGAAAWARVVVMSDP